jgi:sulfite exporter TauE/SafE
MELLYWTALSVGFLGSFHCAGMCGPLAMALPSGNGSMLSMISGKLLYNFGRLVTYSILGMWVGMVGHTFSMR